MIEPLNKKWQVQPVIPEEIARILSDFSPLARQLLYNRGVKDRQDAIQFLSAANPDITDPFMLKGMTEAVDRINQAISENQKIAIYGDYDVDGVTATVLLVECIRAVGGTAREYIPNRFEEGYGVNRDALGELKRMGVDLVITVDCGSRSPDEADYARSIGLDLIITDHHQPGEILPDVVAMINPRQPGDSYPHQDLAGVGLAYKLAEALHRTHPAIPLDESLDLVALGTVADMAVLGGENRYLVRRGLERIRGRFRQGIASLGGAADLDLSKTTATNIGFILGPRLNAAGRLETALDAFRLLISRDVQETGFLSQKLNEQNAERRRIMIQTQDDATQLAFERRPDPWVLFACSPDFNEGVVGLAASRLVERFYRPAIIGNLKGELARFSCRSIPELHITHALDEIADLFIRHGGHAAAAGLTIRADLIPDFIARMEMVVERQLAGVEFNPTIMVDMQVNLADLSPRDYFELAEWLEPTGNGNPEAVLLSRHVKCCRAAQIGKDKRTLKLQVMQGGVTYDCVAFQQGHRLDDLGDFIDLVYTLNLDTYLGPDRPRVQLMVKDIKPSLQN
ncbi:MAG: single-stranded-DNA-specific exonuclease RecJ [Anaerolineaceae bacterium]|nr:single-stranded-DNA-specific exonuclease RecJ [Anaerolineaceae bacterium]